MRENIIVLGIDPGVTSGYCAYDTGARRVLVSGQFDGAEFMPPLGTDVIVIERPKGYGPTRPQLVDCGFIAGQLYERVSHCCGDADVELMTRLDVCKILTAAVHGVVRVRNDATAWAALKELHRQGLHPDETAKKGGPLHGVKAHGRAALAVAFAWAHRGLLAPTAAGVAP